LIEIANALQNINSDIKLDVYGKIPDENTKKCILDCQGINYKGFVSYDEVKNIMKKSDLLVHTENFSGFYREDLKFAFSTKIADSLASGTCFFVYAPEELAISEYLLSNGAACVVCDKAQLQEKLKNLLNDFSLCKDYVNIAQQIAEKNHNKDRNVDLFLKKMIEVWKNY